MNLYTQFLQTKISDPNVSVRGRAMASIALLHQRIPFDIPNFQEGAFEGTSPENSQKVRLLTPLVGDNAIAGIILPIMRGPGGFKEALTMAEDLVSMQVSNGGIYLSTQENMNSQLIPQGDISFAHIIDVHKAFRFFLEIFQIPDIKAATKKIEELFRSKAFNLQTGFFNAGGKYSIQARNSYIPTDLYATDVQLGVLLEFGPTFINEILGADAAYQLWEKVKELSGRLDADGNLTGVGLVANNGTNNAHAKSTMQAILVTRALAVYYPQHHAQLLKDADSMTKGLEAFEVFDGEIPMGIREALFEQKTWWGKVLSTEIDVESTAQALIAS